MTHNPKEFATINQETPNPAALACRVLALSTLPGSRGRRKWGAAAAAALSAALYRAQALAAQ